MARNTPSNAELAQQIQALTNIVANLANSISAMTQDATPAAVAPTFVGFATSFRVAAVKELISFTTKHGISLYEQGTKALETPFRMKASHEVIFEKELSNGASMMG